MRIFVIFSVTTLLAFGLMLGADLLVLPVAFDTQGVGWTAAPYRSALVTVGMLLQKPLVVIYDLSRNRSGFGILSIGVLSIFYGAAATGIWALRCWFKKSTYEHGS